LFAAVVNHNTPCYMWAGNGQRDNAASRTGVFQCHNIGL
jgi:hypothetical protein